MGRRIHKSFWTALCRLRNSKKNTETQCTVLQRGDSAKRPRVIYRSRNKPSRIEQAFQNRTSKEGRFTPAVTFSSPYLNVVRSVPARGKPPFLTCSILEGLFDSGRFVRFWKTCSNCYRHQPPVRLSLVRQNNIPVTERSRLFKSQVQLITILKHRSTCPKYNWIDDKLIRVDQFGRS